MPAPTSHPDLLAWVDQWTDVLRPASVVWCDGSPEEYRRSCDALVDAGTFVRLDPAKRPNSFWAHTDPSDVARVEDRTFIATATPEGAGPTNNWRDPVELRAEMLAVYDGAMAGRTMYVVPFSMGPVGSPLARIGVELTDSAYVVVNMQLMTRMGAAVLDALGTDGEFVRCVHSVGAPLADGQADVAWPCNPTLKYVSHFPETGEIWSYGSGYGGNALLGKKCFALRIASAMAAEGGKDGWLAEHMLILKMTNPQGVSRYVAAAFPSACGKTNLAMLQPTLPGWTVETIGDDIAWMRFDGEGNLRAINPEAGFFGVAPGTSAQSNPNALAAVRENAIFTNTVLTDDRDVWWEGMGTPAPAEATDWHGQRWTPQSGTPGAHPNARFTAPASQCPVIAPEWEDPAGVPISAILFGGRRASVMPLVIEANSWEHGVFLGSIMASEMTAAAFGTVGQLRRDPMAMLPFLGLAAQDYFAHWLEIAGHDGALLPRIFYVNWFGKGSDGSFLWPGYGENSRVLAWVFERCEGTAAAVPTAIGQLPADGAVDTHGLDLTDEARARLFGVDLDGWRDEVARIEEYFDGFGDRLPAALRLELAGLGERLA